MGQTKEILGNVCIVLAIIGLLNGQNITNREVEPPPPEIYLKIILVEFADVHRYEDIDGNSFTFSDFNLMFFSESEYFSEGIDVPVYTPSGDQVFGSLHDYFSYMSNTTFNLNGEILNNPTEINIDEPEWLQLENSKLFYHNNFSNFYSEINNIADDIGLNLDTNGPNGDTKLLIIYAGDAYYGFPMNSLNPAVNAIPGEWYIMSERNDGNSSIINDNINHISHIGIHAQEFSHLLGLVHVETNGVGGYSVMNGRGVLNGPNTRGACPPPINPYYRDMLGWCNSNTIDSYNEYELPYTPENPTVFYHKSEEFEYATFEAYNYLYFENRQFDGQYDLHLPFPNDDPGHKGGLLYWRMLHLINGGYFEYDGKIVSANGQPAFNNGIDNYHVFYPGDNNEWTNVNDFTIPSNTNLINGEYSHFAITNIQLDTETLVVTADFHPNYYSGSFSGVISSDVTFAGSVFVDGDVTVESGGRLIIEPNTTVVFSEGANLKIYGETIINGEEGDEVVFTSESGDYNIIAYEGSKLTFNHVSVENADRIELWNQTDETTFNNCTFDNDSFVLAIEGQPQFNNCTFSNNDAGLVTVSMTYPVAMPTVENCTFNNNDLTGMLSGYRSIPILKGNEFINNDDGLRVSFGSQPYLFTNGADCESQNNLFNDNDVGIRVYNSGLPWLGIYADGLTAFEGYNRLGNNTWDIYCENIQYPIYAQKNHWQIDQNNLCDSGIPTVYGDIITDPTISGDIYNTLVHNAINNEAIGDYILAASQYVALVMEDPDAEIVKWAIAGLVRTYTKMNRKADLLTLLDQIRQNNPSTISFKYASTHHITQLIDDGDYEVALDQILELENLYPESELTPKHLFEEWIIAEKTGGLSRSGKSKAQIAEQLILDYPEDDFGITMSFIQGTVPTATIEEDVTTQDVLPTDFGLTSIYPNPFNPITNITYDIPEKSFISIVVYDLAGRKVDELVSGLAQSGRYNITWNAEQFSSGVYFVTMLGRQGFSGGTTPSFISTQKVVLLK